MNDRRCATEDGGVRRRRAAGVGLLDKREKAGVGLIIVKGEEKKGRRTSKAGFFIWAFFLGAE